jgi:hypothetical protein
VLVRLDAAAVLVRLDAEAVLVRLDTAAVLVREPRATDVRLAGVGSGTLVVGLSATCS